jgi:hypothetical protein
MKNLEELAKINRLRNISRASYGGSILCGLGGLYTHNPKYLIGAGALYATGLIFRALRTSAIINYRKHYGEDNDK